MIFDESIQTKGRPTLETSVFNIVQRREETIQPEALKNLYNVFQIQVNKEFFKLNKQRHVLSIKGGLENNSTQDETF